MLEVLSQDHDGTPNFHCKMMTAPGEVIDKAALKRNVQELFAHEADVALFYFSGHGAVDKNLGG
jgi:hypothetical protein